MSDELIRKKNSTITSCGNADMLIKDISSLIEEARNHVASEYNSAQVLPLLVDRQSY